jgi:hypothetical protein
MSAIKLVLNPYEPNYKAIGDLTLMVHAPFYKVGLTLQSPPNLHDIVADDQEGKLRTVNLSFCNPDIEELEFNLDSNNTHAIHAKDKDYIITLDEIGEEEIRQEPGRKYLYFNFTVEEVQDLAEIQ